VNDKCAHWPSGKGMDNRNGQNSSRTIFLFLETNIYYASQFSFRQRLMLVPKLFVRRSTWVEQMIVGQIRFQRVDAAHCFCC